MQRLEISKLADGGYTVLDSNISGESRYAPTPPLCFACTTIAEALDYIRRKMEPAVQVRTEGFDLRPGSVNRVDA